MAPTSSPP
ncbi:hypothetical protein LINPERHAP2_LOCUS11987 [Linum perenne]